MGVNVCELLILQADDSVIVGDRPVFRMETKTWKAFLFKPKKPLVNVRIIFYGVDLSQDNGEGVKMSLQKNIKAFKSSTTEEGLST